MLRDNEIEQGKISPDIIDCGCQCQAGLYETFQNIKIKQAYRQYNELHIDITDNHAFTLMHQCKKSSFETDAVFGLNYDEYLLLIILTGFLCDQIKNT